VKARRSRKGRGGKGGSEPAARVRLRALKVFELYLEGHSQVAIAQALHLSQPGVSKILQRIEERLWEDLRWRADRMKARQSLQLEHLYAQAVRAWKASQLEGVRRRQRKTHGRESGAETTVAELVSESRHGDPRFLDEARRVLADLRTLHGLNAPDRLAVDPAARFADLSDAALNAELTRQQALLAEWDPSGRPQPPSHSEGHDAHDDHER
jgi:hypothetical protein